MDHNLEDSLNLESMDFDHSEDVVNQEDIPLESSGRLDSITMDMDDVEDQSHSLLEAVSDEVIVSDLIEDPFPFQEYIHASSSHNIMVDPHQLTTQPDPGVSSQYKNTFKPAAPTKSNLVAVKVGQRSTKRLIAAPPPREVAIAPKPPQPKPVQYAIAPKPVALVTNKQSPATFNKIPISSSGNLKGNSVLAQFKKQLVMVPKKIKLMTSSNQVDGVLESTPGIQYQVACSSEQAQQLSNQKSAKPLLKFIQIQGQPGADKSQVFTNVPKARYVMQQKTVPITKIVQGPLQNLKLAGKKKIFAIKSQNPAITSQGNVTTKKVLISNSSQKVLIKTNTPTSTSQVIKESSSTGQRTQYHPINVPGKGIQYIKLVTNQQKPSPKQVTVPSKNFVFTDSKGNVIQMTAEKVIGGQSSSIVVPGTITAGGVVKTVKTQKKLVRIGPVSKAVTQSNVQSVRSSQSLLAPITATSTPSSTQMTSLSLPSISSPVLSPSANAFSNEEFNDIVEQNEEKSSQQSLNINNYIDNSRYSDANDVTNENDFSIATEDYSTANEYSVVVDGQLHDENLEESIDPDESIDVKPTLRSLISDAVSEGKESDNETDNIHYKVERDLDNNQSVRNASFMLQEDHIENDMSNPNESIIIVPGSNYTERINDSMYSDDSQSYRNRAYYEEDQKHVPLLSVEAECLPYTEDTLPESPPPLDPDAPTIDMRPRKPCNCTKSQCLKLYCDCFANGEFCNNCNCKKCHNNLKNEEVRQKAIRSCLERNPNAFRPKIGKSKSTGPEIVRRHTKGCNCKRSGCLKNYCECYEAKIACTAMCKCVGCRNVQETLVRRRDAIRLREKLNDPAFRPAPTVGPAKQPCSFMTSEVIEAVCQCLVAAAGERDAPDPVHDVIDEFARCLQDVISASHHTL